MNLILCGMMCVGKTTVGKKVAELTSRCWVDTDQLIEERHGKISQIFAQQGEAHFRALETQIVEALSTQDGLVISTGGGLVLRDENVNLLKENGKIVFLRAQLETLLSRLSTDGTRPLLCSQTESATVRLSNLLTQRTPIYQQVADYIIDVDEKTVEEVAAELIKLTQIV